MTAVNSNTGVTVYLPYHNHCRDRVVKHYLCKLPSPHQVSDPKEMDIILTGGCCSDGSYLLNITKEVEGHDPCNECVVRLGPCSFYRAQSSPFRPVIIDEAERIADRKTVDEYEGFYLAMQGAKTLPLYLRLCKRGFSTSEIPCSLCLSIPAQP